MPVSLALLLFAAGNPVLRIGILPIRLGTGVDPVLAQSLTAALVAEVRHRAVSAEVIGPDEAVALAPLAGDAGQSGCSDIACFRGVAGGAGVDQLVVANFGKLDPDDVLSIALLDARRGAVLGSAEDRRRGDDTPPTGDRIASLVNRLLSTSEPLITGNESEAPLDPWGGRSGKLDLRLRPDHAAALLDSRPLPAGEVVPLPPGVHRLQVFTPDLKLARELAVDIHAGETNLLDIDLTPASAADLGRLDVKAAPGTEIFVDGDRIGVAPLPAFALTVGSHRVRLVNGVLRAAAEADVKITARATARLSRDLSPATDLGPSDHGVPEQLDRAQIAQAMAHGQPSFSACVAKLHALGASSGTLKLSFRVLSDGRPAELRVSPAEDDPRIVQAERCLGDALARLDFGRYRGPTLERIEQPFEY